MSIGINPPQERAYICSISVKRATGQRRLSETKSTTYQRSLDLFLLELEARSYYAPC